jgi:hypothetical protein
VDRLPDNNSPHPGPDRPAAPDPDRAVRPGWVRVDCHLHTRESGDAVTTLDQLAERVAVNRLDVVCLTEHNEIGGTAAQLSRAIGARVVLGEEIRTRSGELIGLFLTERVPYVLPAAEVVELIRAQGGIVCAPHPHDPLRGGVGARLATMCATGLIDAVEVFNAKIVDQEHNRAALATARAYGLPGTVGSDAHDPAGVGAAYLELPDFDGPKSFVDSLWSATHWGEYRPHAPRFSGPRET